MSLNFLEWYPINQLLMPFYRWKNRGKRVHELLMATQGICCRKRHGDRVVHIYKYLLAHPHMRCGDTRSVWTFDNLNEYLYTWRKSQFWNKGLDFLYKHNTPFFPLQNNIIPSCLCVCNMVPAFLILRWALWYFKLFGETWLLRADDYQLSFYKW